MQDAERRKEKRKKKKEKKEQDKRVQRLNLKMIIPGDEGPRAEEHGLFQVWYQLVIPAVIITQSIL